MRCHPVYLIVLGNDILVVGVICTDVLSGPWDLRLESDRDPMPLYRNREKVNSLPDQSLL
jgi:hypothetical protein